jgi:hypothetical protein
VLETKLKPLLRLATGLMGNTLALLYTLKFSVTNASMKRFNADAARVIARGHGYKDQQYLFLKLRQIAKK